MLLEYNDICIRNKQLIEKGSLDIKPNTITVIRGANGCGKTLLLKNIKEANAAASKNMSLLDQDNSVTFSSASVLESIAMSDDQEVLSKVESDLENWGYGHFLSLKNGRLSGGEQRIVNILRCICSQAEILLMDEPANDLDFELVQQLITLLGNLKRDKTIIIVSHDDRLIEPADAVYEIKNGRVESAGAAAQSAPAENNVFSAPDPRKVSPRFISRSFRYNYINLLAFLILAAVIFIQAASYISIISDYETDESAPEGQLYLFNIYSDTMAYCGPDNVSPLFCADSLGSLNPISNLRTLNQITEFYDLTNAEPYDIRLDSTDSYTVFPLEYISLETGESIHLITYYTQKYYTDNTEEIYIDTSDYFYDFVYSPYSEDFPDENCYMLDISLYNECISELNEDGSLIVGAAIVVLNDGFSSSDFYSSQEIKTLGEHIICTYSPELGKLLYQLRLFQEIWQDLEIILAAMIILMAVNLMFVKLQMRSIRNQVYLFRNYNYEYGCVEAAITNKFNNRLPLLAEFIVFAICLVIYLCRLPFMQVHLVFFICAMIFCSGLYSLENRLIKKYVRNYFRWDSR